MTLRLIQIVNASQERQVLTGDDAGAFRVVEGFATTYDLAREAIRSGRSLADLVAAMPKGEDLATLGKSGATLAIHLSIRNIGKVVGELTPLYGGDCPVVIAFRIGWPDQQIIRGTLADIEATLAGSRISRTAIIFVGRVFGTTDFTESRLYHIDHQHALRRPRE